MSTNDPDLRKYEARAKTIEKQEKIDKLKEEIEELEERTRILFGVDHEEDILEEITEILELVEVKNVIIGKLEKEKKELEEKFGIDTSDSLNQGIDYLITETDYDGEAGINAALDTVEVKNDQGDNPQNEEDEMTESRRRIIEQANPIMGDPLHKISILAGESFELSSNVRTVYAGALEDSQNRESRVILLIGSHGKASLINFLCNHFYLVVLEQEYRYHIANTEDGNTTHVAPITTFVFNDTFMDFRPIVIDTPDTGQNRESEDVSRLLYNWIQENGQLRIDLIGVVFSSTVRMTIEQEDQLQQTLNMFPSHFQPNFCVFLMESGHSSVPDIPLRRFNLHQVKSFTVNTSCLLQPSQDDLLEEHLRIAEVFAHMRQLDPVAFSGDESELPPLGINEYCSLESSTVTHPATTETEEEELYTVRFGDDGMVCIRHKTEENVSKSEEQTYPSDLRNVSPSPFIPPPSPRDSEDEEEIVEYRPVQVEVVIEEKCPTPPRRTSSKEPSQTSLRCLEQLPPLLVQMGQAIPEEPWYSAPGFGGDEFPRQETVSDFPATTSAYQRDDEAEKCVRQFLKRQALVSPDAHSPTRGNSNQQEGSEVRLYPRIPIPEEAPERDDFLRFLQTITQQGKADEPAASATSPYCGTVNNSPSRTGSVQSVSIPEEPQYHAPGSSIMKSLCEDVVSSHTSEPSNTKIEKVAEEKKVSAGQECENKANAEGVRISEARNLSHSEEKERKKSEQDLQESERAQSPVSPPSSTKIPQISDIYWPISFFSDDQGKVLYEVEYEDFFQPEMVTVKKRPTSPEPAKTEESGKSRGSYKSVAKKERGTIITTFDLLELREYDEPKMETLDNCNVLKSDSSNYPNLTESLPLDDISPQTGEKQDETPAWVEKKAEEGKVASTNQTVSVGSHNKRSSKQRSRSESPSRIHKSNHKGKNVAPRVLSPVEELPVNHRHEPAPVSSIRKSNRDDFVRTRMEEDTETIRVMVEKKSKKTRKAPPPSDDHAAGTSKSQNRSEHSATIARKVERRKGGRDRKQKQETLREGLEMSGRQKEEHDPGPSALPVEIRAVNRLEDLSIGRYDRVREWFRNSFVDQEESGSSGTFIAAGGQERDERRPVYPELDNIDKRESAERSTEVEVITLDRPVEREEEAFFVRDRPHRRNRKSRWNLLPRELCKKDGFLRILDTITTQGMAEEALPNQYIIELPLNAATSNISDFEQRQPDKTILYMGGSCYDDEMAVLSEDRRDWKKTRQKMPGNLIGAGVVCINGVLYVVGGSLNNRSLQKLDTRSMRWSHLAEMNVGRALIQKSTLELNGFIWVLGGEDIQGEPLKSVELYDPRVNVWVKIRDMKYPRTRAAATVWNEKIFISGGKGTGYLCEFLKSVECFDPESGVWTELADMPAPLHDHCLLTWRNKLVIMGGCFGAICTTAVAELDLIQENGKWKPGEKNPDVPMLGGVVLDGEIYALGGLDEMLVAKRRVEIFDGERWRWAQSLPYVWEHSYCIIIPQHLADLLCKQ